MEKTNTSNPDYYHQIVNCRWACPAHTDVPEYIRLIARGQYNEAYLINWQHNVFPGILGRTCDRPCEPACRRGRVEGEPVAICRLKRAAADFKSPMSFPSAPEKKNGKRVALIGGGPASLTVARDLLPYGYEIVLFEKEKKAGGAMRYQIPSFRLPETVLNEEVDRILNMGVECRFGEEIKSLSTLMKSENFDAFFVGTGAPRGQDLEVPGRKEGAAQISIGIDWLANVAFGHVTKVGKRVLVIGGGNTAMDCCRTARRLGGEDVKIVVRSAYEEMKASPWEREDAQKEGVKIFNYHLPKEILVKNGKVTGMVFQMVKKTYDEKGKRLLIPTGEPDVTFEADEIILAIGQDTAFPFIDKETGIELDKWNLPVLKGNTFQSTNAKVFFGGDCALGPKNIITAVAQGHEAAISIHQYLQGQSLDERPGYGVNLISQKMGLHDWMYQNEFSNDKRYPVPHLDFNKALSDLKTEVELGFDKDLAAKEAARCLSCDVQTVFTESSCIECDACTDICPMECINFMQNDEEDVIRQKMKIPALNKEQPVLVSASLKTGRVMIKDEDLCIHCAMCAERCPTGAWDMRKFIMKSYAETK